MIASSNLNIWGNINSSTGLINCITLSFLGFILSYLKHLSTTNPNPIIMIAGAPTANTTFTNSIAIICLISFIPQYTN